MKILKITGIIILSLVVMFTAALGVLTLTAYNPPDREILTPIHDAGESTAPYALRILTWNLGYCGIDAETDVFIEGGSMSRARSGEAVQSALSGITTFLNGQDADIMFLQEVDKNSKRSFQIDQADHLAAGFSDYQAFFALNYKSPFVPVPLSSPMGGVLSGLMTVSRYRTESAARFQLPGQYAWPVRIFHLKRCALVTVLPSRDPGRSWYLVNVHLSAFDTGNLRTVQLEFVKEKILAYAAEGHYVVVGGDWNSLFPGVERDQFGPYTTPEEHLDWVFRIPEGWTPDLWQWCYDPEVPTARSNERPYIPGESYQTIIDGFLVSPNLEVREVSAYNLGYLHSDHHPVAVTVQPKN